MKYNEGRCFDGHVVVMVPACAGMTVEGVTTGE